MSIGKQVTILTKTDPEPVPRSTRVLPEGSAVLIPEEAAKQLLKASGI